MSRLLICEQLAVAGILTNDLLGLSEKWWIPDNTDHLAPGTEYPGGVRVALEIVFMAVVESFRIQVSDSPSVTLLQRLQCTRPPPARRRIRPHNRPRSRPHSRRPQSFAKSGPGTKAFDPANMNSAEAKLKEIKNGESPDSATLCLTAALLALACRSQFTLQMQGAGARTTSDAPPPLTPSSCAGRLAMIAFLGFTSQAAVRGLGPIECLQLHLSAPGANNIFTSQVGTEATAAVVALSIAPTIIKFYKDKVPSRGPTSAHIDA